MSDTLTAQAHKATIDAARKEAPQSFTVGGHYDGKKIEGGITYNRTWTNGWGLTAYARAWWDDLPVSTHTRKPKVVAGAEIVKRF